MLCEQADDIALITGVDITQRCEVGRIDCIDYLSNECLFSFLTQFKCELRVASDIPCGFNMCTGSLRRWFEGVMVSRNNKGCIRECGVSDIR